MNGKLHGTIAFVPRSITLQTDSAPRKEMESLYIFGVFFMKIKNSFQANQILKKSGLTQV